MSGRGGSAVLHPPPLREETSSGSTEEQQSTASSGNERYSREDPPYRTHANTRDRPLISKAMAKVTKKQAILEELFGSSPSVVRTKGKPATGVAKTRANSATTVKKIGVRVVNNRLQIMDSLPSAAIKERVEARYWEKLRHQQDIAGKVEAVLMPYYTVGSVTKEEYKAIMRKIVPRLCHKTGDDKSTTIKSLVDIFVKRYRANKGHKRELVIPRYAGRPVTRDRPVPPPAASSTPGARTMARVRNDVRQHPPATTVTASI